ncbi:MAG: hypothetical protein HON27_14475 [Candidatus Marinimicrobia bacterium]|jgi:hypothetical protein|nr:hypothetical protein [Candidatus Neomarinimicrobiota bacterium]MBT4361171.1 hypothetical protein [Candidatus Neomarinimicrobiota bacterium]MBT4947359.1 hypothetical protein [Candidatus Neomarinimicrobiota bacterium]MBT5271452.1 hypothetical protein [Candidatus Neomarinimicrobiota bacterium]
MRQKGLFIFLLILFVYTNPILAAITEVSSNEFTLKMDDQLAGLVSLQRTNDVYATEYIKSGHQLLDALITFRLKGGSWQSIYLSEVEKPVVDANSTGFQVRYTLEGNLEVLKTLSLNGDKLSASLVFKNLTEESLEIGDVGLPLTMNTDYVGGDLMEADAVAKTYQNRLNMHRLINGHGSFIFWMRANGVGPYLLMQPQGDSRFEYYDNNTTAFIHSAKSGLEKSGTWRQEHTNLILGPVDSNTHSQNYDFSFVWGADYDGVRNALYINNGFDIQVIPGMSIPTDLPVQFSLRTQAEINDIRAEFPEKTQILPGEVKSSGEHLYTVHFSQLGENMLTIYHDEGKTTLLEFFVTEPLETLVKKRAQFIVEKQQHKNRKWYNGLYSLWDMRKAELLGPENKGGLMDYMVGGSDDPSNSKCVFLAEKNVAHPDKVEIASLEYFIKNFVWGKHQRTDKEFPHPYGIYGSENWYLNRTTEWGTTDPDRIKSLERQWSTPAGMGLGPERMWRTFDYTTYFMLYYDMYLIAKANPKMVKYLDAQGYLERAYGTARAFFQVPYSIHMPGKPQWSHHGYADWAYKLGNFHEKYITGLMDALENEGMVEQAAYLRGEWDKKVKYFIYDDPTPFGSEFVFDRTAFESTHAIARYAIDHPLEPDENLWFDRNTKKWYSHPDVSPADAEDFMERQIAANISMRGWLETSYYFLGAAQVDDHSLDYMSQMGGWSILDYALYTSDRPAEYLRLGYASLLSSWALVNSGTSESNYGYWYPGPENDGAVGWNFANHKFGKSWMHHDIPRGPWFVDGEIDHGLAGGLNAAATIAIDDPIFGPVVYGGIMKDSGIVPRDGMRRHFHDMRGDKELHLELLSDRFGSEESILVTPSGTSIALTIEKASGKRQPFSMNISGLSTGKYNLYINDQHMEKFEVASKEPKGVESPVGKLKKFIVRIEREG